MDDIRKDPEHKNYISVYRGLAYVGEKLESYTLDRLNKIYQRIYAKEAGNPPCASECSKTFKNQTRKWCATCNGWRSLLLKTHHRSNEVNLEKMHSWLWPSSIRNIAEFYIPPWSQTQHVNLLDIATSCFVWENCKEISLTHSVIKRIRKYRNDYFAHNPSSKVTDLEKAKTFDALKDLLKDNDVHGYINTQECIRQLEEIEQGYKLELWEIALQENNVLLSELKEGQLELPKRLQNTIEKKERLFSFDCVLLPVQNVAHEVVRAVTKIRPLYCFLLSMLLSSMFSGLFYQKRKLLTNTDCISEMYTFPFKQDLPLIGYLSEHRNFVGRDWLLQKIEEDLITPNTTENRGLVLVAEMGYGKSALISNLLCSQNVEKANTINSHIVAFHVCKFNVRSTKFPERFIRRLVGFLAMKSAEYGNIISTLPEESILYDRDSCSKEPDACFDQGITIPLKQTHDVSGKPWIITVDALDECEEEENNRLLDLISSRITLLPKWLKFLITSRNSVLLAKLAKLKVEYLEVNDSRNIEDIKSFILQSFSNPNLEFINNLVSKSDGSFIYVLQTLTWFSAEKEVDVHTLPNFPNDLSEVYEINFDRQFKNTDSYKIPKMILEIICSTTNPLSKHEMFRILEVNNILENYLEFENKLKFLQYFLRIDKEVSLSHQALYYWLISNSNKIYRISLFKGHTLISNFLFSSLNKSEVTNLVDLAFHVANSDNITLTKTFISLRMIEDISNQSLLHKLIWKTSSVVALDLLTHHMSDVDAVNKGNVTPAFVAAEKGHIDQFKLLHKKGANIDFKVRSNFTLGFDYTLDPFTIYDKLEKIKRLYYSGYSCLHIAAQHGHTDVVKYILKHEKHLLNYKNALGLNAGLTACENGHMSVIMEMYKINPKLFGYECMYYASSRNHKPVVEWLLQIGVKFKCISKKLSEEALNEIIRVRYTDTNAITKAVFPNDTSEHENLHIVNPTDKWWEYFRHDPLLAAILHGSLDTAKYIMEVFPNSLKCSDIFGYTAALLSVKLNRTDLFPLLNEHLVSDKCAQSSDLLSKALFVKNTHYCPKGGTYMHIAALNYPGEVGLFIHLYRNQLYIPWNEPDSFGIMPIHYAVVNRNMLFMQVFKEYSNLLLSDARTTNGSTPYHSAAFSHDTLSFYFITDSLKKIVPDLKDNANRTVLHYLALREFNELIGESEEAMQQKFIVIFNFLIETCKHDLMSVDSFGRNVLHYALRYGNAQIILLLNFKFQSKMSLLLNQNDMNGSNPVHFALSNKARMHDITVLPIGSCAFYDVFYKHCNTKFPTIMSSWELSLVYLMQSFSPDFKSLKQIVESNLKFVFHKSAYITSAYFVYFNDACIRTVRHHLMNMTYNPDNSVKWISLIAIAKHKPEVFRVCNETFNESTLHFLMLHDTALHLLFEKPKRDVQFVIRNIFGNPLNMTMFCCSDNRGYNIFHYALISGHILTARFLMREGICVTNEHLDLKDVIQMALTSREPIAYSWNNHYYIDKFFTALIKRHKGKFLGSKFCQRNSTNLSLVHLLAVNGMTETLKTIVHVFGEELLFCKTRDKFTPLYFANIFNNTEVRDFIKQFSKLTLPDNVAEEQLFLYMLSDISYSKKQNPNFCAPMPLLTTFNSRRVMKQYYCLHIMINKFFFILEPSYFMTRIYTQYSVSSMDQVIKQKIEFMQNVHEIMNPTSTVCPTCRFAIDVFKSIFTAYNSIQQMIMLLFLDNRKIDINFFECRNCKRVVKNMQSIFVNTEASLRQSCLMQCVDSRHRLLFVRIYVAFRYLFVSFNSCVRSLTIQLYAAEVKSRMHNFPKSYTFLYDRMITAGFFSGNLTLRHSAIPTIDLFNKYKYFLEIKQHNAFKKLKTLFIEYPYQDIKIGQMKTQRVMYENFVLENPFHDLQ